MRITELIAALEGLKQMHGDLPCVSEYCEQLWLLSLDSISFMKDRAVHKIGSPQSEIKDVIVIG